MLSETKDIDLNNTFMPAGSFAKRCFDVVGSAVGLLLFSPLFLILYVLIKLDDGGPVIYSQERLGRGARPFRLYKFRSMHAGAEADGIPRLASVDDSRQTRVGAFMRKYHIDELPQLWNVLRGDMSIVGYRPERPYFISEIMARDSRYEALFSIKPGLFSKATLYNGYTDNIDKMLARLDMDIDYLNNHGMIVDLKIVLATVYHLVAGHRI